MTINELQHVVLRLANQVPVRYWVHFNYPRQDPWLMALQVEFGKRRLGCEEEKRLRDELRSSGFTQGRDCLWVIERTDLGGCPYRSTGL